MQRAIYIRNTISCKWSFVDCFLASWIGNLRCQAQIHRKVMSTSNLPLRFDLIQALKVVGIINVQCLFAEPRESSSCLARHVFQPLQFLLSNFDFGESFVKLHHPQATQFWSGQKSATAQYIGAALDVAGHLNSQALGQRFVAGRLTLFHYWKPWTTSPQRGFLQSLSPPVAATNPTNLIVRESGC